MKELIAIPTVNGKLTSHFGHCEKFAFVEVEDKSVKSIKLMDTPEHTHGSFPKYLANSGVNTVIVGGMGGRAKDILVKNDIKVIMGQPEDDIETLTNQYLSGNMVSKDSECNHNHHHH